MGVPIKIGNGTSAASAMGNWPGFAMALARTILSVSTRGCAKRVGPTPSYKGSLRLIT